MALDLTARIERLERENRRWRVAGLAAVLLLAGGVFVAADDGPRPEDIASVVRARNFMLYDADGRLRGQWGTVTGEPQFYICTKGDSESQVMLSSKAGKAILNLTSGDRDVMIKSESAGKVGILAAKGNQLIINQSE